MQQQYHTQPQVLMLSQPPPTDDKLKPRAASALFGLSVTQMIVGSLCIVFGAVLIPVGYDLDDVGSGMGPWGYGVWMGVIFLIIGIIGARAAKTSRGGLIMATMVLNIILPATGCLVMVSMTSAALLLTTFNVCQLHSYTYDYWNEGGVQWNGGNWDYNTPGYETRVTQINECNHSVSSVYWALDSLMLVMALVEFVIAIVSSVICCGALCRCCKRQVGPMVQFIARPQQVFVQPVSSYPSVPGNFNYTLAPNAGIHHAPPTYPGVSVGGQWGIPQQPIPTTQPVPPNHSAPPTQPVPPSHSAPPTQPVLPNHSTPPTQPAPHNQPAPLHHPPPPAPTASQTTAPPDLGHSVLPPIGTRPPQAQLESSRGPDIPPTYSSLR